MSLNSDEKRLHSIDSLSSGDKVRILTSDKKSRVVDASAIGAAVATQKTAKLTSAGWADDSQQVTVQGVTVSNAVIVAPAPSSASEYSAAGIVCSAQAAGKLTFTKSGAADNDINVNVLIVG